MKQVTTVGVDLAKAVFTVHGVDAAGHVVLRKTVRRERLIELIASLSPCWTPLRATIVTLAREHEPARRLQGVPGIGPLTASAITATIATGNEFANGRQFAAWLGLVPRHYSTGGKPKLGRITKRGDAYLRTLLMLGAGRCCRVRRRKPTACRVGPRRCGHGVAITGPSSRWPRRTRAWEHADR
jgi:transposase